MEAAIQDDTLPSHITPFDLAVDPPPLWDGQRERVGLRGGDTASAQQAFEILEHQEQVVRIGRAGLEFP